MSVDISVVMCVRNGEQWIGEQLEALAAQDFTGTWEVVVSDNGSTDGTLAVVESFPRSFPCPLIVIDSSDRAGISHARNAGAIAASGRQLAFCDSDDRVSPGWVGAAHAARGRGEIVAGLNREMTWPQRPDAPVVNPGCVIKGKTMDAFIGCNFAVDRDAYFSIGGFDEALPTYGCDDIEFSVRANDAGFTVAGSEDMLVYFRKTVGLKAVLRKVYLSAKAETVLWHRHESRFADRLGLGRAAWEVLRTPWDIVRLVTSGASRDPRWLTRFALTRLGHLMGEWEWRQGRYARTALLIDAHQTKGDRR